MVRTNYVAGVFRDPTQRADAPGPPAFCRAFNCVNQAWKTVKQAGTFTLKRSNPYTR